MAVGRVCSIHNEWCANGNCRWCEPLPVAPTWRPYCISGQEIQQQAQQQAIYAPTQNTTATASSFHGWFLGLDWL